MTGGRVTGGINLYGPEPDTFRGRTERLALALGAWEPGAVHNADLSFTTRKEAAAAPERLAERAVIDQAVGIMIAIQRIDPDTARHQLEQAAAQAGVSPIALARLVLDRDQH
jgi:hypothetical protein